MARPEVTGKKITEAAPVMAKKVAVPVPNIFEFEAFLEEFFRRHCDLDAFSIEEFCRRHSISVPFYYKLRELGLTPREMEKGARVLITREAAADWRRDGVAATAMKRLTQQQTVESIA
jgi:hypothetical protein